MFWISKILSDDAGNMSYAKTIVSIAASLAASAMVFRSITRDLIPYELQKYIHSSIHDFFAKYFSLQVTLIIEQSSGLSSNQIYKAAKVYLGTKISPHTNKFMVTMPRMETTVSTSMAKNQDLIDHYNGASLKWKHISRHVESTRSTPLSSNPGQVEASYLELRFHKKHKNMVMEQYFPYILSESKAIKEERKTLRIHTLKPDSQKHRDYSWSWSSIKLDHPATFATLAMDTNLKKTIVDDLDLFVRRREFYRKVGKAWKRGYLLYGPPGTGKSSLIAAMANYLNFDVYDLELAGINTNADLRRLLINTANRSILVVEDIDCSLDVEDRKDEERSLKMLKSSKTQIETLNIVRKDKPNQVITLSGLLNFTDGLWSGCGDERIIVFTTNHKDRLDGALLRPGRMDMHIHMSYCTPCAFRTLAANYLGFEDHALFDEIDGLLEAAMITPAEVGEQLLRSEDAAAALGGLIEFLQQKIRETDEHKGKELELEEDDQGDDA